MATLAAALPETAPQTRILGASFSWWLLIAPAVILMLAFYAFPLAEVLWISFTEPEPGFGNYERLLRFYRNLPEDWCEELPSTIPDDESLPIR